MCVGESDADPRSAVQDTSSLLAKRGLLAVPRSFPPLLSLYLFQFTLTPLASPRLAFPSWPILIASISFTS